MAGLGVKQKKHEINLMLDVSHDQSHLASPGSTATKAYDVDALTLCVEAKDVIQFFQCY